MDINDILATLNLDLSNPEIRRGAAEAIQAILNSRVPPPDFSGGSSSGTAVDIDLDPDLIQPSQKFNQPQTDQDIEIEDEDDILSQIKQNDAEQSSSTDISQPDNSDTSNSSASDTETTQTGTESEENSDIDASDESSAENNNSADEPDSMEDVEDENLTDIESATAPGEEDDLDEVDFEDESSDEEISSKDEEASSDDSTADGVSEDESEDEVDEEDLLDDDVKNIYTDKEQDSKNEARRIKRERTLTAARKALEKAQNRNAAPALIRELEKAISELESLVEAKKIKDLSDEEFNIMVNRVFDAISALGDEELTFSTDDDRAIRAREIKADLTSRETQQELSDEDLAAIRAETQATKAREKEIAKYKKPTRGSFKGFQDFLNSLYRAIALQVQTDEIQDDTWSAINRRYSGTNVLRQGQRRTDLPDRKIPIIDFYFDVSGSWGADDIAIGKKAVSTLVEMEEKGQIKINIYYFADIVGTTIDEAQSQGCGTRAWNDIVKNIITSQATNVIIMTDGDMESWWTGSGSNPPIPAMKYTVPGYVWYLWRDGECAPRLPRDLKGRGGVQQFSFSHGDI